MVTPILLPKQGNTVETCLILGWKKGIGEQVKKGEVICEVETDKAVFEIESPADGVLLATFFKEGDDVPVLTNIAVVGDSGENYDEYAPASVGRTAGQDKKSDEVRTGMVQVTPDAQNEGGDIPRKDSSGEIAAGLSRGISPRAKQLAERLGLKAEGIEGTGPGGRIIEKDIIRANEGNEPLTLAGRQLVGESRRPQTGSGIGDRVTASDLRSDSLSAAAQPGEGAVRVVSLKGIRKIIADRMLESLRSSAQLTLNSSADATALLNLRKRFKSGSVYTQFQSVTINDLIHYAVIRALPKHPELNSLLIGDKIEYHSDIHLGFAVDTPRGLMVPVIKNAQKQNLLQLSREAKRLAAASQSGKIGTEELNGATFTVTNLGAMGIESFTPVLNLPQTGILGVDAITLRPVEKEGSAIVSIPFISFSLTVDHRVIDGAVGARFLQSLAKTVAEIDLAITSDLMRE